MVTTFPDALLTCKLSSIDFQKKVERQFYKDITNTRNPKIVCIVIVLQLSLIIMFYSAVMPISISTGIKTCKMDYTLHVSLIHLR
jgi:hypothetical protein